MAPGIFVDTDMATDVAEVRAASGNAGSDAFTVFHQVSDSDWLKILSLSVQHEVIEGVRFPRFPADQLQSNFVGSANETALHEAYRFYVELKRQAATVGSPLQANSRILDFGCGWGRYLRFFWKDVRESGLFGVDVDPDILSTCLQTGVPGKFARIQPTGKLPFDDGFFSHAMAYSVFTHLPEPVHLHWMQELARVIRPGGTFTLTMEPRRFLYFIAELGRKSSQDNGWHEVLVRHAASVPQFLNDFNEGKIAYLPTGGGGVRSSDVYGDAVVPLSFIAKHWTRYFEIVDYIDDSARFWQAVLVVKRRAT